MRKKGTTNPYEIGYGKPPKDSQFRKGTSGNPAGRPKKILDFDQELIKEASSTMIVSENGQRKRMSKHNVFIKHLMKQAITGNPQAAKLYLRHLLLARENLSLVAGPTIEPSETRDIDTLTDEELMAIIMDTEDNGKKK